MDNIYNQNKNQKNKIFQYFNIKKNYKIIIFFNLIIFIFISLISKSNNIKICLCTMGKQENLYVREFILYYKKLGIDKIYIYDDNDLHTEKINDANPLKHYAKVFENIKNKIKKQDDAYTDCYNKYKKKYNWFLMIDIDEFLVVVNNTLKNYLSNPVFNKCDFIKIHWVLATDNNLLHYDNRSLFERFKAPYKQSASVKTIIRGNINNLKYHVHSPSFSPEKNISCNNLGEIINYTYIDIESVKEININNAYIIHFQFKSTEEFINKYKRGYSNWLKDMKKFLRGKIYAYHHTNNITKEKKNYIEKELNINLTEYGILIK